MVALPAVAIFVVVPHAVGAASSSGTLAVVAAVVGSYGRRVIPSAVMLAFGGVAGWLLAIAVPSRREVPEGAPAPAPLARHAPFPTRMPSATPSFDGTARGREHLYL